MNRSDYIIRKLKKNRRLAHAVLFPHRHPNITPQFHEEMIDDIHSPIPKLIDMAFRGGAKSTIIEEAMILMAIFEDYYNGIIIGDSFDRGCERLSAIKHEFNTNEHILDLFGDMRGDIWSEKKIVLANGRCIQALGRGQSMRGTKHLDRRPDFAFLDDVEDEDSVETKEARAKNKRWILRVVIPGMDSAGYRIRVAATPLNPESLPMELQKDPSWQIRTYPIETINEAGERVSAWPDREPLSLIDARKAEYERLGAMIDYMQEYMCEATAESERVFRPEMMRSEAVPRTWQAVYCMIDPARTTNTLTSATTGIAAWSWIQNRLVVWEGRGLFLKPDQIVEEVFRLDHVYNPVWLGVEADGLEEFLMQPIRQESAKRLIMPPVRAIRAPKGKVDFIKGLQPFFKAGEVILAGPCDDLMAQLLSFPRGRIDAPNALAYALKLRSGGPVYENFSLASVVPGLGPVRGKPVYLCLNAGHSTLTGILVQSAQSQIRILADFVVGSPPLDALSAMLRDARLECPEDIRVVCGPEHFNEHRNVGLVQAATRIPIRVEQGYKPDLGRLELADMMQRTVRGVPSVLISDKARYALNGLSGGYCYTAWKYGVTNPDIEDNIYATLIQGLESFCGFLRAGSTPEEQDDRYYSTSRDGRRYLSAFRRES